MITSFSDHATVTGEDFAADGASEEVVKNLDATLGAYPDPRGTRQP
jgi:hypothetical protein